MRSVDRAPRLFVCALGMAFAAMLALAGGAGAQPSQPQLPLQPHTAATAAGVALPDREALNSGTVTVITAPIGGPMSVMGSDMAAVLDDGDNLRVLPILGKGSAQNLVDIIMLKNIDMGF